MSLHPGQPQQVFSHVAVPSQVAAPAQVTSHVGQLSQV
jgi:hypothetical protein